MRGVSGGLLRISRFARFALASSLGAIDAMRFSNGARSLDLKGHDNPQCIQSTDCYESIKPGTNAHAKYYFENFKFARDFQ